MIEQFRSDIRNFIAFRKERASSVKIGFHYHLTGKNLDKILAVTEAVKAAKDIVATSDKNVRIFYGCPSGLTDVQHSFAIYGPDVQAVTEAFRLFLQTAGTTPDFVSENIKLAENVLEDYGKKLQRRIEGGLVGRYVVDM